VMIRKGAGIAVLAAAVMVATVGCGTAAAAHHAAKAHKVANVVPRKSSVVSIEVGGGFRVDGADFTSGSKAYDFVVAEVTLVNTGKKPVAVDPKQFVVTAAHTLYPMTVGPALHLKTAIKKGELAPKHAVTGYVVGMIAIDQAPEGTFTAPAWHLSMKLPKALPPLPVPTP